MSDLWVFYLVLVVANQGLGISYKSPINPDFPHQCWLEEFQMPLQRDEAWTDRENCVRYMCFAMKRGKVFYSVDECSKSHRFNPECILGSINTAKDYPECCPDVICY